jgi:hypothetical protein
VCTRNASELLIDSRNQIVHRALHRAAHRPGTGLDRRSTTQAGPQGP